MHDYICYQRFSQNDGGKLKAGREMLAMQFHSEIRLSLDTYIAEQMATLQRHQTMKTVSIPIIETNRANGAIIVVHIANFRFFRG